MTGLAAIFGGGQKAEPAPPPPAPRISDAAGETMAREHRIRQKKKYGADDTILTGTAAPVLGASATMASPAVRQRSTLG